MTILSFSLSSCLKLNEPCPRWALPYCSSVCEHLKRMGESGRVEVNESHPCTTLVFSYAICHSATVAPACSKGIIWNR